MLPRRPEARRFSILSVHAFDAATSSYTTRARSAFVPDLDLALVARFAPREDITLALREFEAASGISRR